MNIVYIRLVQAQEVAYLATEKCKPAGFSARRGVLGNKKYIEADRSREECHITIPILEDFFCPAFNDW